MAALTYWVVFSLGFVILHSSTSYAGELVDMTACSQTHVLTISGSQIYTLYADKGLKQGLSECSVTLSAPETNTFLLYIVETLVIPDCDISIQIYDLSQSTDVPSKTLTCNDTQTLPVHGQTTQGELRFSIHQKTAQPLFKFRIQVTTSLGPPIYTEEKTAVLSDSFVDTGSDSGVSEDPTPNETEGGSGNIGLVIGITVAAIILVVAVVGIIIYCCLKNRNEEIKDVEVRDGQSAPSVFTSGTSQVMFAGANNHRTAGGGTYGSMEDVRSSNASDNVFSNKAYQEDEYEKKFNRQGSYRREKGSHKNAAFDESDYSIERGGHLSRRDSGRGVKYEKKKNFSRNEEYEMSKVNKMPVNGILKTRSKSPNRSHSSTEGSTVDSNALVYGYSQTTHAHPNTQHIPVLERTRSRSRSRGASSHRSGSSTGRPRSSSLGKASGKDMSKAPKGARQYNDMSHFLEKPKHDRQRPRSRSGSVGRRTRSDSRTSENVPSEVSFAPSGTSSKKNTGGKRVHIQGVESDI